MKRIYLFFMLLAVMTACQEAGSNSNDTPPQVKPSNLAEAAELMGADSDYQKYVSVEKKLKTMLALQKIDMEEVGKRMSEPENADLCLWSESDVKNIKGAYEYAQLLCRKIALVKSLYQKFPFLKTMGAKDRQYLLSRDTRISVTPEEVLTSMAK